MTISSLDLIIYAVGDGTTGPVATPAFVDATDVRVLVRQGDAVAPWVLGSDYTLSGGGTGDNGTLTPLVPKPDGAVIVVYVDPDPTQDASLGALPPDIRNPVERALDRVVLMIRQLKALQRGTIRTSLVDLVAQQNTGEVSIDATRLGQLLLWDQTNARPVEYDPVDGTGGGGLLDPDLEAIAALTGAGFLQRLGPTSWALKAQLDIADVAGLQDALDAAAAGGSGESGSDYGLVFDGTTDQTEELNAVLAANPRVRLLAPANATGPLFIAGTIDPPDGSIFDFGQVDIDRGPFGRIFPQGAIAEVPDSPKMQLAANADAGDTTLLLNLVVADNGAFLEAGKLLIIRGEKDASGVAIEKEEHRIASVTVTGSLTRTVVLETPLQADYDVEYPGSAWVPGDGFDKTRISVAVGSLLTGNVARYARVIPVDDGSLFAAGDMVLLRSDAMVIPADPTSIPFGEEPAKVYGVSGNNVTLDRPIGRPFLTADGAGLYKVNAKSVTLIGGPGRLRNVGAPPSGRRIDYVGGQFLRDSKFQSIRVDATGFADDARGHGVSLRRCIDVEVIEPDIRGRANTGAGDGNGVFLAYCKSVRVWRGYFERCRHGEIFQGGDDNIGIQCRSLDCYVNGHDLHGGGEARSGFINCEATGGLTIAPDSSQQGGLTVGNTRWRGGVVDCFVEGFRASGFEGGTNFGIVVRPQTDNVLIQDCVFSRCATGIRLIIDDRAGDITIDGVRIIDPTFTQCGQTIDQAQNDAPAWQSGEAITATTARPRYRTSVGGLWAAITNFTTGGSAPSGAGPHNDGGGTWTRVANAENRILNVNIGVGNGNGGTPLTVSLEQPAPRTTSFVLGANDKVMALDGSVLRYGRFVIVDPEEPMEITLNSALSIGEEWFIRVVDEDYPVTLVREAPIVTFAGDITNASAIITNIPNKTGIENGYLYIGPEFPGGTTVVDRDHGSGSIEMSAAATSTVEGEDIVLSAGKQGTINGSQSDVLLRKGAIPVKLIGDAFGADVIVRGDIAAGGGPMTQEVLTTTGNTDMVGAHFGKSVIINSASGDPTYTILSAAELGVPIPAGTWIKFFFRGSATSFTLVEGSDVGIEIPLDQTFGVVSKGVVTVEYLGSNAWAASGALVPADD